MTDTTAGEGVRFEHGGCRVQDIAYTAFMMAKQPNDEDGGPSDWFNDTWPTIKALIAAQPSAGAQGEVTKLLLKVIDTLKPFAVVAEQLAHCHVVEICEPHADNPSPNIVPMPREWFERAADDLEAAAIRLHCEGVLSEGQASKMTGLDRVEVRKLADATPAQADTGDVAALREALEPFACLEVPSKSVGNAGAYSILHSDIRRAQQTLAALSKPNAPGREG